MGEDLPSFIDTRWNAVLLVGPTGAGKTPLGQVLQAEGLWDWRCLHFDFGRELRQSIHNRTGLLTEGERELVARMLQTGALLEDKHFPIARKLLDAFMQAHQAGHETLIVLNGLPRHIGQARVMQALVHMRAVISLECTPEVVLERIRTNAGGDREGRIDDSLQEVKSRLKTFTKRTSLLLRFYRELQVRIINVPVQADTGAQQVYALLEQFGCAD